MNETYSSLWWLSSHLNELENRHYEISLCLLFVFTSLCCFTWFTMTFLLVHRQTDTHTHKCTLTASGISHLTLLGLELLASPSVAHACFFFTSGYTSLLRVCSHSPKATLSSLSVPCLPMTEGKQGSCPLCSPLCCHRYLEHCHIVGS